MTEPSQPVSRQVDDLEERIVDVEAAREKAGPTEEATDEAEAVPGSPEPPA